jgi:hypothetical protein
LELVQSVYDYPLGALLHVPEVNYEVKRDLSSISNCHDHGGEISFRPREPSGVFTSELSAIFTALVQIRDQHPGKFIILSDSMSSLRALQTRKISPKTHSLVYEIKEASWWPERHGYGIHIMWIPSHVGVMGNERADHLAGEAVQSDTEFAAPV